jgi:hypothetical protein
MIIIESCIDHNVMCDGDSAHCDAMTAAMR